LEQLFNKISENLDADAKEYAKVQAALSKLTSTLTPAEFNDYMDKLDNVKQ
jgi:hypothetical protein